MLIYAKYNFSAVFLLLEMKKKKTQFKYLLQNYDSHEALQLILGNLFYDHFPHGFC